MKTWSESPRDLINNSRSNTNNITTMDPLEASYYLSQIIDVVLTTILTAATAFLAYMADRRERRVRFADSNQ